MVEQLAEGLTREYVCNGQIVILYLENVSRKTIDVWFEVCLAEMKACNDSKRPVLMLNDNTAPKLALTPYIQEKSRILTDSYPDLTGRVAIILPNSLEAHRIRLFVARSLNKYTRERQAFFSREAGLKWLTELAGEPCEQS